MPLQPWPPGHFQSTYIQCRKRGITDTTLPVRSKTTVFEPATQVSACVSSSTLPSSSHLPTRACDVSITLLRILIAMTFLCVARVGSILVAAEIVTFFFLCAPLPNSLPPWDEGSVTSASVSSSFTWRLIPLRRTSRRESYACCCQWPWKISLAPWLSSLSSITLDSAPQELTCSIPHLNRTEPRSSSCPSCLCRYPWPHRWKTMRPYDLRCRLASLACARPGLRLRVPKKLLCGFKIVAIAIIAQRTHVIPASRLASEIPAMKSETFFVSGIGSLQSSSSL